MLAYLLCWPGSQRVPAGVGDWNKAMGEVGGENLCDPLEIPQTERKGRELQQVACYRARDETGVLEDLEET